MTSGGTEATFTALLAARARALPDAWARGVPADPPVVVCGEHAHYATTRAVAELGLGTDRVVPVPSVDYRMDPDALAATLDRLTAEGRAVMAVAAAAGCTPTGSFDDLDAIGAVCDARGLWLHVDAAQGGAALLSDTHCHRLRGLARARTVAWDPHKALGLPISAGLLLARDERDLDAAFAQRAPYIFHGTPAPAEPRVADTGVRSFLCARRADVLKLWVALERHGTEGLAALYDHTCAVAQALYAQVRATPGFEAPHAPEANILCFRYVGDGTAGPARLDAVNRAARERYNASGHGWVTTTVLGGRRVLRVTVANPRTTPDDARALLAGLADAARAAERDFA
jgi:L-2,4-diaminobutyrate decarboxylase